MRGEDREPKLAHAVDGLANKELHVIMVKTAFGVRATDDFGHALAGMGALFEALKAEGSKNSFGGFEPPSWAASCYSAEDIQMVAGFECPLSKAMDFPALDARWRDYAAGLPSRVRDALAGLSPDVVVMAGVY